MVVFTTATCLRQGAVKKKTSTSMTHHAHSDQVLRCETLAENTCYIPPGHLSTRGITTSHIQEKARPELRQNRNRNSSGLHVQKLREGQKGMCINSGHTAWDDHLIIVGSQLHLGIRQRNAILGPRIQHRM